MRFYNIIVSNQQTNQIVRQWTSMPNGKFDPNALNIEVDFPVGPFASPLGDGGASIAIEGVSLLDLGQAQDFKGLQLTMYAGMSKGLPLADPKQQGLILSGQIFQSFGNWQGTDMSLNFVIVPSIYSYANPGNIVLNWKAGTQLNTALQNCLSTAYPQFPKPNINIGQYAATHDQVGFYSSLSQLAQDIASLTQTVVDGVITDQGVHITIQGGALNVYDQSHISSLKPIQLNFTDLIGQPTWIAARTIQFKCVMRGDIPLLSQVQLPTGFQSVPGLVLTSANSFPSQQNYKTTFNGLVTVTEIRHVGSSRSTTGDGWVTIFTAIING